MYHGVSWFHIPPMISFLLKNLDNHLHLFYDRNGKDVHNDIVVKSMVLEEIIYRIQRRVALKVYLQSTLLILDLNLLLDVLSLSSHKS